MNLHSIKSIITSESHSHSLHIFTASQITRKFSSPFHSFTPSSLQTPPPLTKPPHHPRKPKPAREKKIHPKPYQNLLSWRDLQRTARTRCPSAPCIHQPARQICSQTRPQRTLSGHTTCWQNTDNPDNPLHPQPECHRRVWAWFWSAPMTTRGSMR